MSQLHNVISKSPGIETGQALRAASGLGDEEDGLLRLGETLEPSIDILARPEFDIFRRCYRSAGNLSLAAGGAGTFAKGAVFNPAKSGFLVYVVRMQVGSGTTQKLNRRTMVSTTGWAAQGGLTDMDRRSVRASSVAQMFTLTDNTAPGFQLDGELRLANDSYDFVDPIILDPGTGVMAITNVAATNLEVSFIIWERPIAARELLTAGL